MFIEEIIKSSASEAISHLFLGQTILLLHSGLQKDSFDIVSYPFFGSVQNTGLYFTYFYLLWDMFTVQFQSLQILFPL